MDVVFNKYYYGYPVCFKGYSFIGDKLEIFLINIHDSFIKEVKIQVGTNEYIINVNSNEHEINISINNLDMNLISTPVLDYVISDDKKYVLDDYKNSQQLSKPKSISFLGREKHLYVRNVISSLKCKKELIKNIPFNGPDYWICTCGNINFGKHDNCSKCNIEKEKLFSVKTIYEREAFETNGYIKINTLYLIWSVIIYFLYFMIQVFSGDFVFDNMIKNEAFGVWHRVVAPLLVTVFSVGYIIGMNKYNKIIKNVSYYGRIIMIFYLNFMFCFFTIHSAYLTIFIIGVDILSITYLMHCHFKIKKLDLQKYILMATTCILFVIGGIKLINFSKYDLTVIPGGLLLKVYTQDETYNVPEEFDNIKVTNISFDLEYSYNIKQLNISKNLNNIDIYANGVLPKLEKITLNQNNDSYYLENDVLYLNNKKIELVPITVKKLILENEVIDKNLLQYTLGLEEVIIKNSVKEIESYAFYGCPNLRKVTFEEGSNIKFIDDYAFGECKSLESIDLPVSLQELGIAVFYKCDSIKSMKIPFLGFERETEANDYLATDLIVKLFGSGDYLCSYYIPLTLEEIEVYDITLIHNVTFYKASSLKNITLSEKVTQLGTRSFYECSSLIEFKIPNLVNVIPESCFQNCTNLKTVIIPENVTEIKLNAFKNCISLIEVIYEGDINNLVIQDGNEILKELLLK